MNKSESIKELATALSKFQATVGLVKKDSTNPFFHSKYADLSTIIEAIRDQLSKQGLSFAQFPDEKGLTTILMHISGEWISSTADIKPKDDTPQAQGSAITYMRRYALSAVLGIATEDDDDGNSASTPAPHATPRTVSAPVTNSTTPKTCSVTGSSMRTVPAGTSKAGKPYSAFETCGIKLDGRFHQCVPVGKINEDDMYDQGDPINSIPF